MNAFQEIINSSEIFVDDVEDLKSAIKPPGNKMFTLSSNLRYF